MDPGRVREVRARLPDGDELSDVAHIFDLLGDPNRLRLMTSLLEAGELCVGDLAATVGMRESAVSHALALLRAHRVVRARRDGRMTYYSLRDGHVRLLLDVALEHIRHDVD